AQLDVADAVVNLQQLLTGGSRGWTADAVEARGEGAVVVAAVHERVDHLPIRVDRAAAQDALLAIDAARLQGGPGAARGGLAPGGRHVVDGEGDVVDPVAVAVHV